MDITLEAFLISGGVILFLFAITMIMGEGEPESEIHLIKDYKHVTIFPIAMPSIASPGATRAVVILTGNHIHTRASIDHCFSWGYNWDYMLVLLTARFVQDRIEE